MIEIYNVIKERTRHMMPYCAPDPPSHYVIALPRHPRSSLTAVEDSSSAVRIYHSRSRRWRNAALMFICTLLMFLTMISAFADRLPNPSGVAQGVLDSSSAAESGCSTASNDSKCKRREFLRKRATGTDQHIRQRGLTTSMYQQVPSALSLKDRLHRRQSRYGTARRFTFPARHRVLVSSACTNKDISIFQSADGSSGIPRYAVQIMNNCISECAPSNIHVFCGWFASALLVNPNSFKRVAFNDCVVNAGKPLKHGETLRFTYANSFMYPLHFKSATFCK